MNPTTMSQILGAGRLALGAALVLAPDAVTPGWVGRDGATTGGRILARGLGVRDAVLGLAALGVAAEPSKRTPVLAAGVICDLIDAGATAASDDLPSSKRAATLLVAGGAAIAGAWAAAA